MLWKAFNLQFCVLFMMFQGKSWITPEWGFWWTDLCEFHNHSLLCKYQVVVELWMTLLCQQTAALSWACHCVLINQRGQKQSYKQLFRWGKSVCLPPSYQSTQNALFICRDIRVKCATLYVLAKIHTPSISKALYFSFCTHTLQKSGPSILHHSLVFLKGVWLRYPIGRSNSCH